MPEAAKRDRSARLPRMVSTAQNMEDVMLRRALLDIERGFYVDVGACHPTIDSVTSWFYGEGWSGINIEPVPGLIEAFERERPRDVNLGLAAGAAESTATLHVMAEAALSSLADAPGAMAVAHGFERGRDVQVRVATLSALLNAHAGGREIDFLKIDTEGTEAAVLAGLDLAVHRPRIVVVEATEPLSQTPSFAAWEPGLLAGGYRFAWFDGLNRFYVREEDSARLAALAEPPSVFDHFVPLAMQQALDRMAVIEGEAQQATVLRAYKTHVDAHVKALDEHIAFLIERVEAQAITVAGQEDHIAHLQAGMAEQARLIEAQHQQIVGRAAEIATLNDRVQTLSDDAAAIQSSTSWRITAPIRGAADRLRLQRASKPDENR